MNVVSNLKEINLFGKFDMNDDGEYEIQDETGIINVTQLLEGIYNTKEMVYISVMRGDSLLFEEDGAITKRKDQDGVLSFYVCGANLEYILFYNTGETLDITLKKRGKNKNNGSSTK
jgi:hypothetical protein